MDEKEVVTPEEAVSTEEPTTDAVVEDEGIVKNPDDVNPVINGEVKDEAVDDDKSNLDGAVPTKEVVTDIPTEDPAEEAEEVTPEEAPVKEAPSVEEPVVTETVIEPHYRGVSQKRNLYPFAVRLIKSSNEGAVRDMMARMEKRNFTPIVEEMNGEKCVYGGHFKTRPEADRFRKMMIAKGFKPDLIIS